MIKAVFKLSPSGEVLGFSLSGHSGAAESGQDILCAAVSGAVQCVITVIEEGMGITGCISVKEGKDNRIECDLSSLSDKTEALKALKGFMLVMEMWEKDFPENINLKKL